MAMAMAMEATMTKHQALKWLSTFILFFQPFHLCAAEVTIESSLVAGAIYSDNVNHSQSEEVSTVITSLSAAVKANVKGNDGNLSLNYIGTQALYSHDSSRNTLFHNLSLKADKKLNQTGFSAMTQALISHRPKSARRDANDDPLVGDTITQRELVAGMSYDNSERGFIGVSARAKARLNDLSDDVGNSLQYTGALRLENGTRVKSYFWVADYNVTQTESRSNDRVNESHKLDGELGLAEWSGFVPFVNYYGEQYRQQGGDVDDKSDELVRVGPGVRYFFDQKSYAEVTYNFIAKGNQDNYLGSVVNLQPSRRTKINFEYSRRFFGESYAFSLSHKNKRWTNVINYTEEPESFNRDFYDDNNLIEDFALRRSLNWTTTRAMRRGSFSFKLLGEQNERTESSQGFSQDSNKKSSSISYSHKLTRDLTLSTSLAYQQFLFDQPDGSESQTDHYSNINFELRQSIKNELMIRVGTRISTRTSTNDSYGYDENRLFFTIAQQL